MNENLENKVCLITGATNGIGQESAKALNNMGAEIVFVARNEEKGNFLKQQLKNDSGRDATMIIANLSSQAEVKRAANEFLALEKPLDILLNNAGIMNRQRTETVDGLEEVFSVNHLAYFTLSLMLLRLVQFVTIVYETSFQAAHTLLSATSRFYSNANFLTRLSLL